MSDRISLDVQPRTLTGKKVAELRKQGLVPAVIYGKDFAPVNVQAPLVELNKAVQIAGTHTPLELVLGGKKQTAIIKNVAADRAKNRIQHVSFQAVKASEVVTTEVPIVIVGEDESEAKKAGLLILQNLESLEVKAKTSDLPSQLEVSAANLKAAGDKLTIGDIKLPRGVEIVSHDEDLSGVAVASAVEPAALAAANEAADQAAEAERAEENSESGTEEATDAAEKSDDEKPADEAKPDGSDK
ncbi:MAG: 50S ribosomal protein L25 [Candidatus Nomurabacteria bacterium]|jgi:large subunit ribosomal protein L25|nr:50S ribosomal protein L25 [Candidatus Nomurabacteria bacterium]